MSLQLKEGKMTGKEIANWLNISYDYTYRRNPQKYLEKLKEYCDYEQIRGGAIISNIRIPIYCPNMIQSDKDFYRKEIERCVAEQEGIASTAGIARLNLLKEENEEYTFNQMYYRMKKVSQELFGDLRQKDKDTPKRSGSIGTRKPIWAVKLSDENQYRKLKKDEAELLSQCFSDFYSSLSEEKIRKRSEIDSLFFEHYENATVKEYKEELDRQGVNFVHQIIFRFLKETGLQVVSASEHTLFID